VPGLGDAQENTDPVRHIRVEHIHHKLQAKEQINRKRSRTTVSIPTAVQEPEEGKITSAHPDRYK
jgi:hypothetical protein